MASKRRNHLLWIGPLVTFVAAVSYFELARFPALRDVPWLNLPLVLLGVALSAAAVRRAFGPHSIHRGRILGPLGLALSLLLAAAFLGYVFWFSYTLPEPTAETLALVEAPDFELAASDGSTVRLADYRGTRVVLVFYRGFWWPFCQSELQGLQRRIEEIRERGAEVLAVSVDPPGVTRDKLAGRYDFPLLADPGLEAIDAYGVRHPDGYASGDIARPATFLIDGSGRIVWRELTDNWRIRLRPERLLEELDRVDRAGPATRRADG